MAKNIATRFSRWSRPEDVLAEIDQEDYLDRFKKREITARYFMEHVGFGRSFRSKIYMDTHKGILLSTEGRIIDHPLAFLGYESLSLFGEVVPTIMQIQSRRLSKIWISRDKVKSLNQDLRWERMLVSIFEEFARKSGASLVGITPAENTEYYRFRAEEEKEREPIQCHRNRLKLRYDGTARRMGYKYDGNHDLYLKALD